MTNNDPLKKALDEVLMAELGISGRDNLWRDLWSSYGITLEDLTTLDKMQNTLQLAVGNRAPSIVRAAFSRYIKEARLASRDIIEESR